MTESDPLAALRAGLKAHREALGLNPTEAAARAGITGQRWRDVERGYELKHGVRIPANPRRSTLLKMIRAVGWDPVEALELAGKPPLALREVTSSDPLEELARLAAGLPVPQQWALVVVARAMADPTAPLPGVPQMAEAGERAPDPTTSATEWIVDTPQEPGREQHDAPNGARGTA